MRAGRSSLCFMLAKLLYSGFASVGFGGHLSAFSRMAADECTSFGFGNASKSSPKTAAALLKSPVVRKASVSALRLQAHAIHLFTLSKLFVEVILFSPLGSTENNITL